MRKTKKIKWLDQINQLNGGKARIRTQVSEPLIISWLFLAWTNVSFSLIISMPCNYIFGSKPKTLGFIIFNGHSWYAENSSSLPIPGPGPRGSRWPPGWGPLGSSRPAVSTQGPCTCVCVCDLTLVHTDLWPPHPSHHAPPSPHWGTCANSDWSRKPTGPAEEEAAPES